MEPDPLDVPDEDAQRAGDFAQALLGELDAPKRQVERTLFQRWWRVSLVALVLILVAIGVRKLSLGSNLLADKPLRVSSSWVGCSQDPACPALLFHTDHELNPWVEFDMGARKTFRRSR